MASVVGASEYSISPADSQALPGSVVVPGDRMSTPDMCAGSIWGTFCCRARPPSAALHIPGTVRHRTLRNSTGHRSTDTPPRRRPCAAVRLTTCGEAYALLSFRVAVHPYPHTHHTMQCSHRPLPARAYRPPAYERTDTVLRCVRSPGPTSCAAAQRYAYDT